MKVANLLAYEPIYWHMIPHKVEEVGRIRLPALRIEGQAPQCGHFISEGYGADLNANLPLTQVQGWEETYNNFRHIHKFVSYEELINIRYTICRTYLYVHQIP